MIQLFEDGYEEGEGLAASSLGGCKEIMAFQSQRYGSGLDVGEDFEMGGFDAGGCGFTEG